MTYFAAHSPERVPGADAGTPPRGRAVVETASAGNGLGRLPSTALIIAVELPAPIEALRLRGDPVAIAGCPAHVTLLFPFAAVESITPSVVDRIAAICVTHEPFVYELVSVRSWPETVYLEPAPAAAFRPLQADLASAFPGYPLYGVGRSFEPHVTIAAADGERAITASTAEARRVSAPLLPLERRAERVDLIAQDGAGEWNVVETFTLGPPRREG